MKLRQKDETQPMAMAMATATPPPTSTGAGQHGVLATIRSDSTRNRKRDIAKDAASVSVKGTIALARELTPKREDGVLPKAVSDFIERIESDGSDVIERMVIVRKPVQEYVGKLMQIVSFGKYREVISGSDYDQMFHLSLLINGRYVLEKNEVICLTDPEGPSKAIAKGSEAMAVKIPQREAGDASSPLTVALLLDRTKRHMGPRAFSNYCAKKNNCQDFILAVLQSNDLAYPHLMSFVKQDSETIFNQLPGHTKLVARSLTNVAAVGSKVAEDIGKLGKVVSDGGKTRGHMHSISQALRKGGKE